MNNYTELTERMNTAKAEALSIGECWNAMDEAADAIEALVAERDALRAEVQVYEEAERQQFAKIDALRAELDAIKKQEGNQTSLLAQSPN